MYSELTRRQAMSAAVSQQTTVISGKVKLKQETHGKEQAGFLMYVPIYQQHMPRDNETQRLKALYGFVYSPYRMGDLMEGILGNQTLPVHFEIYDGVKTHQTNLMYDSADHLSPITSRLKTTRQLNLYGHRWTIELASTPAFEQQYETLLDEVVLSLGSSLSLLLFFYIGALNGRKQRAEQLALQMTQEIRENQQVLQKQQAQLQAVMDNAQHLIMATDTQGIIQILNHAAELQLGFHAADIIGKQTPLIWHAPEEIAARADELGIPPGFEVLVQQARLNPHGETREWCFIRQNGNRLPVSLTISAIRNNHGEISAYMGIATDISERLEAARIMHDQSVRLSAILDHVLDGIITIDLHGIVQSFNASAEQIFGYHANEVLGQNVKILMPAPYFEQHDQYLTNYLNSGQRKIIGIGREVEGRRKNGELFPMDLAVTEMQLGGQRYFTGIIRDITERKRYDEDLRVLSRAVEQSPVAVLITDAAGNIEYVNSKVTSITGYEFEELLGQNPRIFQSGLTPSSVYQDLWQNILAGKEWRGRLQNCKKDGELFWEDIFISPVLDQQGRILNFVAVKEDVSDQVKVEKMKSEFVSTVSHELRTPLTSIRGSLALMMGGALGPLPPQMVTMLDIAKRNSERLILLVNDILDIEKIEAGKMELHIRPHNLITLLKHAIENNAEYASQFQVAYQLQGDLRPVWLAVDDSRLLQVLTNLLSNAAKFSPTGAAVNIEVTQQNNRVRVAVHNRGEGIPPQYRAQLFQKFVQVDSSDTRKKGGTGLGLAISKALVEGMGGIIDFESQPKVLTTFYIEFNTCEEAGSTI